MAGSRFSIRSMIVAVAVVSFDVAAMARALQQGQAAHAVRDYAIGFGLVLLLLNLDIAGLVTYYTRTPDRPTAAV